MIGSDAGGAHVSIPIDAKKMANTPSTTMTMKMRLHHRGGGPPAERLGAALDGEPLDARDDADHQPP